MLVESPRSCPPASKTTDECYRFWDFVSFVRSCEIPVWICEPIALSLSLSPSMLTGRHCLTRSTWAFLFIRPVGFCNHLWNLVQVRKAPKLTCTRTRISNACFMCTFMNICLLAGTWLKMKVQLVIQDNDGKPNPKAHHLDRHGFVMDVDSVIAKPQ